MVLYDMQDFGGLEEYALTLACGLQQQGHEVSFLFSAWVPEKNQYLKRLRENRIERIQIPKWVSLPASDWETKEKMLRAAVFALAPLTWVLAAVLMLHRRRPWRDALASSRNWLKGKLMSSIIASDRRNPLTCTLLNWWRLRWRPDVLHIHGYTTNLLFVLDWAYRKKMPVVYEEHQTPDARFDWWRGFRETINKANLVVAVSEKSAQALKEICGVTQPIAVAGPIIPDPALSGWKRSSPGKKADNPLSIVTVARLYVTKGLQHLLDAIPRVKAVRPSVDFKVYGEGALRAELAAYAAELGLDGEKIFVGAFTDRKQLSQILGEADIFVLPSVLEGQPFALVEAMAHGCAIVATAVGGIPELIRDGVNGLLCEPADPDGLARKIVALMDDPGLRLKLGDAARRSYEDGPFQPVTAARHFVRIYQSALRRKQGLA
ncbi:MAG: glycosyltransferase family 4 protein [Acidobacteria bacterium]|nr:glycosyltransferase family 4 protein [Acidobacteriota bacterium]